MRIRWKAFWIGAGIGLIAGLVLLQKRRAPVAPPLAVDQLASSELLGEWYELAVKDPTRGSEDRIGTRYSLSTAADGLSLAGSYHLERFDHPRRECRSRLEHQPPGGRLRIEGRELWLLELSAEHLVAASPDRRAVWILARQSELAAPAWQALAARLQAHDVDLNSLTRTPHQS